MYRDQSTGRPHLLHSLDARGGRGLSAYEVVLVTVDRCLARTLNVVHLMPDLDLLILCVYHRLRYTANHAICGTDITVCMYIYIYISRQQIKKVPYVILCIMYIHPIWRRLIVLIRICSSKLKGELKSVQLTN